MFVCGVEVCKFGTPLNAGAGSDLGDADDVFNTDNTRFMDEEVGKSKHV